MVEEANLSDGSDDFGDIVPPTPPPVAEEKTPLALYIIEPTQELLGEDSDEEEDDDDEEDDVITLKEYYAKGTAKTDREKFYVMFCDHLKNIISGCKKEWKAILHTQHVCRIHDHLDPEEKDTIIESILQDAGIQVSKKWAKPALEDKQICPGLVQTYLVSLAKFYEFVVDHVVHKVSGFPRVSEEIAKHARSVSARFKGMPFSNRKEYAHAKWEKQMEEEVMLYPSV